MVEGTKKKKRVLLGRKRDGERYERNKEVGRTSLERTMRSLGHRVTVRRRDGPSRGRVRM